MRPEAVVYLGPSLPRAVAEQMLDAEFRPPIRRGDLAQLPAELPRWVGIVDGEFYQSLSVSTKEILPLLEAGVTVLGASSMGALRAMELRRHGMLGVGRIFRMYVAGEIDGDDEVAVTYCPETYRPLSEPLVNFRLALADARAAGVVSAAGSSRLIRRLKSIYFPERTVARFWQEAAKLLPGTALAGLRRFFADSAPDAKGDDARALLEAMRSRLSAGRVQD